MLSVTFALIKTSIFPLTLYSSLLFRWKLCQPRYYSPEEWCLWLWPSVYIKYKRIQMLMWLKHHKRLSQVIGKRVQNGKLIRVEDKTEMKNNYRLLWGFTRSSTRSTNQFIFVIDLLHFSVSMLYCWRCIDMLKWHYDIISFSCGDDIYILSHFLWIIIITDSVVLWKIQKFDWQKASINKS